MSKNKTKVFVAPATQDLGKTELHIEREEGKSFRFRVAWVPHYIQGTKLIKKIYLPVDKFFLSTK